MFGRLDGPNVFASEASGISAYLPSSYRNPPFPKPAVLSVGWDGLAASVVTFFTMFRSHRRRSRSSLSFLRWPPPTLSQECLRGRAAQRQRPDARRKLVVRAMAKNIAFDQSSRSALQAGVEKLANAVGVTLGPRVFLLELDLIIGYKTSVRTIMRRNVVLYEYGAPKVVSDGVTIARAIELWKMLVVRRYNVLDAHCYLQLSVESISVGNDEFLGTMIADAIDKVGSDGMLSIESSSSFETTVEVEEEMEIDRGYISPQFVTNPEKLLVEFENAKFLLIITEDATGEALATLVVNKLRGILNDAAIKAPGFGERRKALLQDIAIVTGILNLLVQVAIWEFQAKDLGLLMENVSVEQLGTARKITILQNSTTLIAEAASKDEIQIQLLVTILEKLESLEERIKKIEGKTIPQQQPLPEAIIQTKEMTSRASNPPVTTLTRTRTEETPLFEDQVREYRQNQRRRYNAQRSLQRITRRITGGVFNNSLEQQMDPQVQLRLSIQERTSIVPAEVLYHSRRDDAHHRVYMHRSEEAMLVTSNQVGRAFIQPDSFNQLQRSGMRFLHMGVIQVRIQILHRQEEGTLALIVFRNNRWQGDQAIFATMEVYLTHGSQLVYVIPDTMLTIADFYQNIQVSILARGYENWKNGEANLLITRGLVGRLSNTPNVGFAYNIQNVVDYLASHGVRALPGRRYNTRDVQGHNWIIRQSTVSILMQPTEVNTRNILDGSVSLQFDTYQAATSSSQIKYNAKDEEVPSDEEEITNHIIAVLTEAEKGDEELLVRRISASAVLPVRRSHGTAGYDLSIDYAKNIAPNERRLLTTGICIQVPEGLYARIAPRSSAALRGIIIMGGVIDTDYKGEIKILHTIPLMKTSTLKNRNLEEIKAFGLQPYSDEECAQEYDFYVAKENTLKMKGKAIQITNEGKLDTLSRKARDYRVTQHKFYEEEAYLNLIEGPPTMASSLAQTARMLQDSREYRRRLQQKLDEESPPTNFLSQNKPSRVRWVAFTDFITGLGIDVQFQTMDASRKRLFSLSSSGGSINTADEEARYQGIPTPEGPYQLLDQYEELSRGKSPKIFGPQEKDLRAHLEDIEWTTSRHILNSIWELKLINDAKKADFEYRGQLRGGLYFKDSLPEVTKAEDELLDLFIKVQNILQRVFRGVVVKILFHPIISTGINGYLSLKSRLDEL
ncbi:hypothetical protein ZIOFF_060698 [Zingiber officinale]|uniref:dUTPase-like domain-containing protein n=1 Tax=Zingiber officinale TaxID=94328 RepID=A0A8J5F6Q0_ZINOF|nr:hypothetical protein ZIOFF_060698 [Zingiber officinale]